MQNSLLFLLVALFPFFSGKPAKQAHVYLELGNGTELVAYQVTGKQGKVSFKHFDEGVYQILISFPQQEGKFLKEKTKHQTLTKASYNPKNKTYYYQGLEGFFAIKLSGLSKIEKQSLHSIFREVLVDDERQVIITQFKAKSNGASITLAIQAITAAQFKKDTDKISGDISTLSIQNMN